MKLIKIGEKFYSLDGMKLVETTPESAPADGTYLDASELAAEFDGIGDMTALSKRTNELIAGYNGLRTEAAADPAKLTEARAAQELAAVAMHLHGERKTQLDAMPVIDELDEPEAATAPNKPVKVDDDDADSDAGDGDGDGSDAGDAGDGSDVVVPDDVSSLTGDLATVAAAMTAAGADPAAVIAALTPGAKTRPSNGRPPSAPAAAVVAGADTGFAAGHELTIDEIAVAHQRFGRGVKRGRLPGSMSIGSIELFGSQPNMIASSETVDASGGTLDAAAAADFHARRAGSRGITAAAPDRCGPSDVRREIKYAGDDSAPLLGMLESYPAPHCKLEYYRDIGLAAVADGVGRWDAAARDAYQDALDAWRGDMTAANLAALKAAEKLCVIANCPPTDVVDMLPIYACMEYPTDLEYCSPQAIRSYWRALNRAYTRERSANFLAVLATKSARITVDASAGPFVSSVPIYDGTDIATTIDSRLGATAVIDYVMSSVLPLGVMTERVTAGNYVAVIPYGLQKLLEFEQRLADAQQTIAEALGVSRVVTTLDVATGTSLPWGAAPPQDGTTTDFVANYMPPSAWDIAVFDPEDWFAISRPDIEIGAQVTPETVRGNMAFGGFMESFEGYGKDGAHPSYTIALSELVYNGGRPHQIPNVGLLGA